MATQREVPLTVSLAEVFSGTRRRVRTPCPACGTPGATGRESAESAPRGTCARCGGTGVDPSGLLAVVDVPPGVAPGDRIRARAPNGGEAEELDVVIRIREEDPPFRRSGKDVLLDLKVSPEQAERGGRVEVPTLAGPRRVQIPAGAHTDHLVRLVGFGLPEPGRISFGDQLVRIVVESENAGAPSEGGAGGERGSAPDRAAPGPAEEQPRGSGEPPESEAAPPRWRRPVRRPPARSAGTAAPEPSEWRPPAEPRKAAKSETAAERAAAPARAADTLRPAGTQRVAGPERAAPPWRPRPPRPIRTLPESWEADRRPPAPAFPLRRRLRRALPVVVVAAVVLVSLVAVPRSFPGLGGTEFVRGLVAALLVTGSALLASWFLSVVETRLAGALAAARERVRLWREEGLRAASARSRARLREFLEALAAEPRRSLLVALDRLGRATEEAGAAEAAALERLRRRMAEDVEAIAQAREVVDERERLMEWAPPEAPASAASAVGTLFAAGALASLLVAANVWLLGGGAAPSSTPGPVAPPLPAWPVGDRLLALWLSACAVISGIVLYGLEGTGRRRSLHETLMRLGPYALTLVVAAVQGGAYVAVATQVGGTGPLASLEAWTPDLFPASTLVFLVGAVGPPALAVLGYVAWLSVDRLLAAASAWAAARRMERNTRALLMMGGRLRRLDDRLDRLRLGPGAASRRPAGEAGGWGPAGLRFRFTGGGAGGGPAAVKRAADELRHTGRTGGMAPAPRTPAQAAAALAGNLLLLGVWAASGLVLFRLLSGGLVAWGTLGPLDAGLAAGALVLALGVSGFVAKESLVGASHWTAAGTIGLGRRGRRALADLALALLGAGGVLVVWAAATGPGIGPGAAAGGALAALLLLALATASLNLDQGLVSAAHAVRASACALPWLACLAARAGLLLTEAALAVAGRGLALAVLPGRRLSSARSAAPT